MSDIINNLRKQAQEIADEGLDGWGNTMSEAADTIAALREEVERLKIEPHVGRLCFDITHDSLLTRLEAAEGEIREMRGKVDRARYWLDGNIINYCGECGLEIEYIDWDSLEKLLK